MHKYKVVGTFVFYYVMKNDFAKQKALKILKDFIPAHIGIFPLIIGTR